MPESIMPNLRMLCCTALPFGTPRKTARGRLLAVAVLAVALGGTAAQAQKIAIVDMQKAVLFTSDGKKAAAAIDAKFAPLKAQLEQLQKDITAKQDQFLKNRATMNEAAISAAQSEIEAMSTSLKRKREDAQQDLQEEENNQLGAIMPKLQQVINAYALLNQFNFVVDTSANPNNLVYAHESINITAAVVAAYEKASGAPAAAASPAPPNAAAPKTAAPAAPKTTAPAAPKTTAPAK